MLLYDWSVNYKASKPWGVEQTTSAKPELTMMCIALINYET